jgi:peptidoglycan/xylan/chitin deacetylase (PgdA/CDA1 family)
VDDFLSDLNQLNEEVYAATGYQADLVRFPEGSANHYNRNICKRLSEEITRRGYTYHDWSVDSGDGEDKKISADEIVRKVERECRSQNRSVIRFHDTAPQDVTEEALERIIDDLEEEGYAFRELDNTVEPFHFRM